MNPGAGLRRLTERATRGWVIRRRLPREFGGAPLLVTPEAALRYLFHPMERVDPALLNFARDFVNPGDTVWDIGANVGLFTFAAAARAQAGGRVVALEADVWLTQLLRRSAALQGPSTATVEILPAAASERVEPRTFAIAERGRATNALEGYGSSQTGGFRRHETVMAVSLDWLANHYPPPRVLKIDVEGAELEVLKGAAKLLREARPVLACEVSSEVRREVGALLRALDYTLYDLSVPAERRRPLDHPPFDTLALPREHPLTDTRS